MARTIRKNIEYAGCLRRFRNMNYRRNELNTLEEFLDNDITPNNRLVNFWSRIPEVWDDYIVSANKEYLTKAFWNNWWERKNAMHFTLGRKE